MTASIQLPVARITRRPARPAGYTVIEILVTLTISLVMMLVVVTIIGRAGTSIATSRATLEMSDRLRETQARLAHDLQGITVTMSPPRDPAANEGYFEYTEGPLGPAVEPSSVAVNLNDPNNPQPDTTVGDVDDMLLLTTHNETHPFVGRMTYMSAGAPVIGTIQSPDAEVAWFVRGRTLYRRVLLVAPQCMNRIDLNADGLITPVTEWPTGRSFYEYNDISIRRVANGGSYYLLPNTLGDLTKPENRYVHQPAAGYPYHPHMVPEWFTLKLPTLGESAADLTGGFQSWFVNGTLPVPGLAPKSSPYNQFDAWTNPYLSTDLDPMTGLLNSCLAPPIRVGEDVVLNNVIGFDVKAWDPNAPILQYPPNPPTNPNPPALLPGDPGYYAALQTGSATTIGTGAYVDLGYARLAYGAPFPTASSFYHTGAPWSNLVGGTISDDRVYDTWSTHYERDGLKEVGNPSGLTTDAGTNGFDDDVSGAPGYGIVDDALEQETSPPYPVTLRGIQIKIRIFEPDSRQVREVTVVEKF